MKHTPGQSAVKWLLFASLGLLLLESGCTSISTRLQPVSVDQAQTAQHALELAKATPAPKMLEVDARVVWSFLTTKGGVDVSVRLLEPAYLHAAVTDPLGRSIYLAASDGAVFTVIEIPNAAAFSGSASSEKWRSYIPSVLQATELRAMLTGRLPESCSTSQVAVLLDRSTQPAEIRYQWTSAAGVKYLATLDSVNRVRQLQLTEPGSGKVLQLVYAYEATSAVWPTSIQLSGSVLSGSVQLTVTAVRFPKMLLPSQFRLTVPAMFKHETEPEL